MADERLDSKKAPEKPLTSETPAVEMGVLVPQQHGGSLRHGNLPGQTAGPGRPPAHVRHRALHRFSKNLKFIDEVFAPGSGADIDQKLKALDLAGKYGLGTAQGIQLDDVRQRLVETLRILQEMLPAEFADAVMNRIEQTWQ